MLFAGDINDVRALLVRSRPENNGSRYARGSSLRIWNLLYRGVLHIIWPAKGPMVVNMGEPTNYHGNHRTVAAGT